MFKNSYILCCVLALYVGFLFSFGLYFKGYSPNSLPVLSENSGITFPDFSNALVVLPKKLGPDASEDIFYIRVGLNEFREYTNGQFETLAAFQSKQGDYFLIIGQWNEYLVFRKDEKFSSSADSVVFNMSQYVTDDIIELDVFVLDESIRLLVNGDTLKASSGMSFPVHTDTLMMYLGGLPGRTNSWRVGLREFEAGWCSVDAELYLAIHLGCMPRNSLVLLDFLSGQTPDQLDMSDNSLIIDLNPELVVDLSKFLTVAVPDGLISKNYIVDFVLNLCGFIPFGFLFASILSIRRRHDIVETEFVIRIIMIAVLGGFFISTAIETVQLLIPSRTSSIHDLLFNSMGTMIGAYIYLYALITMQRQSNH